MTGAIRVGRILLSSESRDGKNDNATQSRIVQPSGLELDTHGGGLVLVAGGRVLFLLHRTGGPERYLIYFFIMVMALCMEALYRYKTDTSLLRKSTLEKHRTAIGQTLAAAAGILAFLVATKDQTISRVFMLCFSLALCGVLFASACGVPRALARFTFSGINKEITPLIGPSSKALALKIWLRRKADLGIHTVGMICDESGSFQPGFPVLGGTDDFERVARNYHVTQVILIEFPMFSNMLNHMTATCERLGVRLLIANDL